MTDAELRALLIDCLTLWAVQGRVAVGDTDILIETPDGTFIIQRADPNLRPVRWFLQTPDRHAAGRSPRATPSIVALLSALRSALGGEGGRMLRVGG